MSHEFRKIANEEFYNTVETVIEESLETCMELLPTQEKIITHIGHNPFYNEDMQGAYGYATDGENMYIFVNPEVSSWRKGVEATVAHEYNHCIRHQHMGTEWPSYTVRDLIALDGLAQIFEEKAFGELPKYLKNVDEEDLKPTWEATKPHLDEKDENNEIYQGIWLGEREEIPYCAGYKMSFVIVRDKIEELGISLDKAMKLSSEKLIGNGLD